VEIFLSFYDQEDSTNLKTQEKQSAVKSNSSLNSLNLRDKAVVTKMAAFCRDLGLANNTSLQVFKSACILVGELKQRREEWVTFATSLQQFVICPGLASGLACAELVEYCLVGTTSDFSSCAQKLFAEAKSHEFNIAFPALIQLAPSSCRALACLDRIGVCSSLEDFIVALLEFNPEFGREYSKIKALA